MSIEDFGIYRIQAKGKYLRKFNQEVIDIKLKEDKKDKIIFEVKGIGQTKYEEIVVEKKKD